eukprot:scaffold1006_cov408-Prasinococcus_capsulatus_cf.AAC.13
MFRSSAALGGHSMSRRARPADVPAQTGYTELAAVGLPEPLPLPQVCTMSRGSRGRAGALRWEWEWDQPTPRVPPAPPNGPRLSDMPSASVRGPKACGPGGATLPLSLSLSLHPPWRASCHAPRAVQAALRTPPEALPSAPASRSVAAGRSPPWSWTYSTLPWTSVDLPCTCTPSRPAAASGKPCSPATGATRGAGRMPGGAGAAGACDMARRVRCNLGCNVSANCKLYAQHLAVPRLGTASTSSAGLLVPGIPQAYLCCQLRRPWAPRRSRCWWAGHVYK